MMPPEPTKQVQGAGHLADCWNSVALRCLTFATVAEPDWTQLVDMANSLKFDVWRTRCTRPGKPCADSQRPCLGSFDCVADALFPVHVESTPAPWRMGTLVVRSLPRRGELQLIAIGPTACRELASVGRWFEQRWPSRLSAASDLVLSDFLPGDARHWRVDWVTPWMVEKVGPGAGHENARPALESVAVKLADGLAARAHKFTALALDGNPAQALGGHLARYVAREIVKTGLRVSEVDNLRPVESMSLRSVSNGRSFEGLAWAGSIEVEVMLPEARPWLALLALCGVGENVDEGFGAVEVTELHTGLSMVMC